MRPVPSRRRYWFPKHYSDAVQRLRVPMGFAMAAAFIWLAGPSARSLQLAAPLIVAGLGIRAWAAGYLAKNRELATGGPYRHVRNPLYLGTLLAAAGFALAGRQPLLIPVFALVFLLVYVPAIELEEQKLRELFADFDDYVDAVPMILPRGPKIDSTDRFDLRLYRKNEEYNALLGALVAGAYLVWKAGLLR